MLGFLLARAGVEVRVLEKHPDFLRDFRGDTVHPSTLDVIAELGLLEEFLRLPHREVRQLRGQIGDTAVTMADFAHTPTRCHFIALMPQWHFLNFLTAQAARWPTFQLQMRTEVTALIEEDGRVVGVRANTPDGPAEFRADLVIGADGRHSVVRRSARLEVQDIGAPIDVLWVRLPRSEQDATQALGYVVPGRVFIALDRGDYWQCAFVIRKGQLEELRLRGIKAFRSEIARIVPLFAERVETVGSWDDVKLLTVKVDRLRRWFRPGLLCIGDAAHAMSPIGGVGINLAVQDAVATANLLAGPLRAGALTEADLLSVQRRRLFPTRVTQAFQVLVQNRVLSRVLATDRPISPPWPVRMLDRWPALQRIPARAIGVGVRPEHVRAPAAVS
jgi:2-polyprenyl-6-methoxyphenol hydroxylase-like FAD-dependent oxidoreductase